MADDDTSAAPWGRPGSGGRRPSLPTPSPDATIPIPAAPPPDTTPAAPPPTPPPPPSPPDAPGAGGGTEAPTAVPPSAGGPADPPTHTQTPPPTVPPEPPRGPGLSGGALVALAAIVVVALIITGVGVFLVTKGDDTAAPPVTVPASTPSTDGPASTGAPTTGTTPDTVDTTATTPSTTLSTDDFPFSGGAGIPGNLPDQLPRPDGSTDGAVGVEVAMPVAEVAAFYQSALPGEGYTVTPATAPLEGGQALQVEGNGLTGQLLIAVVVGPDTSILWIPG